MTKTHEELLREAFERDYDKWSMVDVDLRWNDSARCYVNQSTHIAFGGYQAALQTANAAGECTCYDPPQRGCPTHTI